MKLTPGILLAFGMTSLLGATSVRAATINVPADYPTIQAAINAAVSGADDIVVAAGTYTENLTLSKNLILRGAQSGVPGCGRAGVPETVVNGAGTPLLQLQTGSAGSTIDGFSFSGSARQIESISGPLDGLTIANNLFAGFTGQAMFLNDNGINVTINQNSVDGSSKTGSGALVHLDTDNFDGLYLTTNCIRNNSVGTGFNVDGDNNADAGTVGSRAPLISRNLLENNVTGMGLGSRAFGSGTISNNTFQNNGDGATRSDGLQGGIRNSTISGNQFLGNGRWGLALTSFGNTTAARGAFGNTITGNTFTGNDSSGYFISASMFATHAASNTANNNDLVGNGAGAGGLGYGATYRGSEVFNVGCNWWGSTGGPDFADGGNPNPPGDAIQGPLSTVFSPWLTGSIAGSPMCDGVPVELSRFNIE